MNPDTPEHERPRRKRARYGPRAIADQPGHVARRLMHGRQSVFRAFRRDDGRWDIEGRLVDVKTHDIEAEGDRPVAAGEPYRTLSVTMTLDERLSIRAARVETDSVRAAARVRAAAAARTLVGRSIDAASRAATQRRFDLAAGCTHLSGLLGMLMATALEAISPARPASARADGED